VDPGRFVTTASFDFPSASLRQAQSDSSGQATQDEKHGVLEFDNFYSPVS